MALVVKDRVRETSTTTGTGTFTLAGAVAGFQSFTAIGTGNTTYYTIVMSGDWEVGLGTWTSPDQLSRDTVLASSNAGALVPFGSGTKDVFCTFPAEGFALPPSIGGTTPNTITGTTVTANTAINLPAVVNVGYTTGIIEMVDGGDGYDYLNLYTTDGTSQLSVNFPGGATFVGNIVTNGFIAASSGFYAQGNGIDSGFVAIRESSSAYGVSLTVPTTLSINYTLTLPSTAGSANQVLKTDGTGVLSWTNTFILGAGTATVAPLQLTPGTNLTTPSAGAMEYDGKLAYFTPANTSRALLPNNFYYRKNTATTLSSATGNQAVFGLTNGVTVSANTIYEIECEFQLTTTGTTSHTEAFGFILTTATVTNMGVVVNRLSTSTTSSALGLFLSSVTPNITTGALTTAQQPLYRIKGTIAFSTGGSINPVIQFSAAPGGTSQITLGAWMKLTPIGTTGSNVSIGTWS